MSILSLSLSRTPDAVLQSVDWNSSATADTSLSATDAREQLWATRAAANSSGDTVPVLTIGQGIPIVFCKRASSIGGCWIQPQASLFRFANAAPDGQQDVTIDYWLILSDGQLGSTSLPAWYGDTSISNLTASYNATSHSPGFTPANTITDITTTLTQRTTASCPAGKSVSLSPQNPTATVWTVTWAGQTGYDAGRPSDYNSATSGIPTGNVTFTATSAADIKEIRKYAISMKSGTTQTFESQSSRSTYWNVVWNAQGFTADVPANFTSGTTGGTTEATRSNTFTAGEVTQEETKGREISVASGTSVSFTPSSGSAFKRWSCTFASVSGAPTGWSSTTLKPRTVTSAAVTESATTYYSASCQGDGGTVVVGMQNDKNNVTSWSVSWTPNDTHKPSPSGSLSRINQTITFASSILGNASVTYTGFFTEVFNKPINKTYYGVISETYDVVRDITFVGTVTEHYMVTPNISYTASVREDWTETIEGPVAPANCGTAGTYAGLTCARMTVHQYGDKITPTIACNVFVASGIQVYNVKTGTTASSNQAPDLFYYLLTSVGKVATSLIDLASFQAAVDFCTTQNFTFDGVLARSVNIREFIQKLSIYFLLNAVQNSGVWKLKSRLPITAGGAWSTAPITPVFTFTNAHIEDGTWQYTAYEYEARRPIMAVMSYRSESGTAPPEIKTVEVDNSGDGVNGPFERFDMSEFCCSEAHARTIGEYIVAQRKYATHAISFVTSAAIANVEVGDFIRVQYSRNDGTGSATVDHYYIPTKIVRDAEGNALIEAEHLPTNPDGSSLVASLLAA